MTKWPMLLLLFLNENTSAPSVPTLDFRYSRSLVPRVCFGFDDEGGLIWIRLQPAEVGPDIREFLSLVEAPLQYA